MAKLMQTALSLLTRREYSRYELGQKLKQRFSTDEVDAVLNLCVEQGLLSNTRFLESRVRHRLQQGYGPLWIQQDLREHRLDEEEIAQALSFDDEFWMEQVCKLIDRKFGRLNLKTQTPKIQRYLYQKGYSFTLIQQALKQAALLND
jgi:regulatory protein